jgi:thiol-disulfide isomerase/thioredoxin
MKKMFKICCFFLTMITVVSSCKKDEPNGGSTVTTSKLTVSLSKTSVDLASPENIYATVKDQNNVDVTSSCTIKVNGTTIIAATYTPTQVGNYVFIATKDTVSSAPVSLNVTSSIVGTDSLYVSLSNSTIENNGFDNVDIMVKDKSGNNITATCQLLLNTMSISTPYTATTVGNFTVKAAKGGIPSTVKNLTVTAKGVSPFSTKIVIEDLTGAWCGYCPRVADKLDNYVPTHPNCIVVGVHAGQGTDPFKYQYYSSMASKFAVGGYPAAILNRSGQWSENTSELTAKLAKWAPLGLALESTVSGTNVTGKVKVKFNVTTNKPMKIVIALVENGLVYPQTNYYSPSGGATPHLYGGANPITNFVHNGVLRKAATDIFGDVIPGVNQVKNNTWEMQFTIPLSGLTATGASYTAVAANSKIIAFVLDDSADNTGIYNAQIATVGTVKAFD